MNNSALQPGMVALNQQEQYKRQNSSKQSYTAQQMGAKFQGAPIPGVAVERSSGLTQTGSISPAQPQRYSAGREADLVGQVMSN
jgi:hypothetical protein